MRRDSGIGVTQGDRRQEGGTSAPEAEEGMRRDGKPGREPESAAPLR